MATKLEIFNMAIGQVGGTRMATLGDTHTESVLLNENYATILDEILAMKDWGFARKVAPVAKTVDPAIADRAVYAIPSDCVLLRQVGEDQYVDNEDNIDWTIENNLIFIDGGATTMYLRYTKRETDTTKFSAPFVTPLILRLAMQICIPISANVKVYDLLTKAWGGFLQDAGSSDGSQGKARKIRNGQLIRARLSQ